jgi:starch phosphorylase
MRDRARLARLVSQAGRPVLFLFAGKAHPADQPGQQVLREIKQLMLQPEFAGRVVFLEDYDIQLARWLVTGVDVWLNNPIAPLEASGTSGIKAAVNGRLNLSILDGWWAEAYSPACGFAFGGLASEADDAAQDEADAEALYAVLQEQVLPAYYERDEAGLPQRWIALMRESIAELGPRFGTARMATEYVERLYLPAHEGVARPASRVA